MSNPLLKHAPLLPAFALLFAGCIRNTPDPPAPQAAPGPQAALAVREAGSPAGADSREPELFTGTDGRVILSWVEKGGERGALAALRPERYFGVV